MKNDKDKKFEENLAMGIEGENIAYDYLINNYGLVEDKRSQKHGEGHGPRMRGTEGIVVLPDFVVYNKPGSPKGKFAVDVKVKSSLYTFNGKECFTVDKKFEDYKRAVDIIGLDFLSIIFIYNGRMHFYKDSDCIGHKYIDNAYGKGNVYYFEYDKSKMRF